MIGWICLLWKNMNFYGGICKFGWLEVFLPLMSFGKLQAPSMLAGRKYKEEGEGKIKIMM